jgi:hypothetical protein
MKYLVVLKHGDGDQSAHGNRDGAGDDDSSDRSVFSTDKRVEGMMRLVKKGQGEVRSSSLSTTEKVDFQDRLMEIDRLISQDKWGLVEQYAQVGFARAEDLGADKLADAFDRLTSLAIEKNGGRSPY